MLQTSATIESALSPAGRTHGYLLKALMLLVAFYAAIYCIQFLGSPIGRFPVLDGAENVRLAKELATSSLAHEPFYRAMLYPALLSLFLRCGFPADSLTTLAAILGWIFHLGSTFCVYKIARRLWASPRAGLVAATLFGLNPIALYFSAELLDTSFALFLFLGGVAALHSALSGLAKGEKRARIARKLQTSNSTLQGNSKLQASTALVMPFGADGFVLRIAAATALVTLATLARPHYLMVLLAIPVAIVLVTAAASQREAGYLGRVWSNMQGTRAQLLAYGLAVVVLFGTTGIIQKHLCGRFQIMPTQGGYSLWVGNRPGANGRYYEQKIHIPPTAGVDGENPARLEADLLYSRETGQPASDPNQVSHYWRRKTLAAICANPLEWTKLMTRKVYYLFNDFEQYNNKTFLVEKRLFPVLRWNPLGWGFTLVLCVAAAAAALGFRQYTAGALPLLLITAAYALGVVLFFVSDRFRLPLLPLLCVGAGGWGALMPKVWRQLRLSLLQSRTPLKSRLPRVVLAPVVTGSVACALTFTRIWNVYDLTPAVQDYVLLSIAAEKSGKDLEALKWARSALAARPDHPDALACAITSFYNAELQGLHPERLWTDETWELQVLRGAAISEPAPSVRVVRAVALWKTGAAAEAQQTLRGIVDAQARAGQGSGMGGSSAKRAVDDALGLLLLTHLEEPGDLLSASSRASQTSSFYLLAALESRADFTPPKNTGQQQLVAEATPLLKNLLAK